MKLKVKFPDGTDDEIVVTDDNNNLWPQLIVKAHFNTKNKYKVAKVDGSNSPITAFFNLSADCAVTPVMLGVKSGDRIWIKE